MIKIKHSWLCIHPIVWTQAFLMIGPDNIEDTQMLKVKGSIELSRLTLREGRGAGGWAELSRHYHGTVGEGTRALPSMSKKSLHNKHQTRQSEGFTKWSTCKNPISQKKKKNKQTNIPQFWWGGNFKHFTTWGAFACTRQRKIFYPWEFFSKLIALVQNFFFSVSVPYVCFMM